MSPIKYVLGNKNQITLLQVYLLGETAQVFLQLTTLLTVFQVKFITLNLKIFQFFNNFRH
jgi:hypothetical protein